MKLTGSIIWFVGSIIWTINAVQNNFILYWAFAVFYFAVCIVYAIGFSKKLLSKKKHEFDMENPLIDEIESQHKHSLSGETQIDKWTEYGWKCKNCDKVLWLSKEMMDCLPKSMKYGCKGKK